MKGAKQCISFLHNHNIKTVIVSAGLNILANKVAKDLSIDYVYANGVKTDEHGNLTGEGILNVKLIYKDEAVTRISKHLKIPLENCGAIGNSCFDIPMLESCSIGIAFNPSDDCVRKCSDIVVEGKDLYKIIPAIKPFI
jgi:phosphoserine phosphatase